MPDHPPPDGYMLVQNWLALTILTAVGIGFTALALALRSMWARGMAEQDANADEAKSLVREMIATSKDNSATLGLLMTIVKECLDELKQLRRGGTS